MAAGLLVSAVGVAQAQTIRGQVFVPNPSFNERIEVRLEKEGGQLLATAFSDTTGVFLFYDTPSRLMSINLYSRQQKWESALEQIDAYLAENPKAADRNQIQVIRSKVIQNLQAAPK